MSQTLVIVESPAKAKTIARYLGAGYTVLASYGHVRDLVPKSGAVDVEHDFAMRYAPIDRNKKAVDAIHKALRCADTLYLATDPDREGEAICWHLCELLKERGSLQKQSVKRVVFHEVTERAVKEAVSKPRELSHDLINAQQARRALDYLVGFNLSPLLWKKIQKGLSAGRVQSPALRMIVEREKEIEAFKSREYWTIAALGKHADMSFKGNLTLYQEKRVEQFSFGSEAEATEVKQTLDKVAKGALSVIAVKKKQRKRAPVAPFITSTLQQESVRKLGFSAQKTMVVAQQLYEGVEIDGHATGLITYMRTDSVALSSDALTEIRQFITARYGADSLPLKPRRFQTTTKNAQEAHECIRPTSAAQTPESLRKYLKQDQFRLYELIWKRLVASQMRDALFDTVSVDFSCGSTKNQFRATGSTLVNPGFMRAYQESNEDEAQPGEPMTLPAFAVGDVVRLNDTSADQHFTEPPPRYSEASLVKTLEAHGIGRPSTYASIISTLAQRDYMTIDKKRLIPSDIGRIVNDFLSMHFPDYVDYDFTATLEDNLDEVARGKKEWVPLLHDFWDGFSKLVIEKEQTVTRQEAAKARVLGEDPKTGAEISTKMGRYGPYVQSGKAEGEEKPRFAGLRKDQRLDSITLEEALELLKLPRDIGAYEGAKVVAAIGRFGPYISCNGKFYSLSAATDDPYTIELERAVTVIEEKKQENANRVIKEFKEAGISVLRGRYGPYITDGKINARVPKGQEPADLALNEAQELLKKAPSRGRFRAGSRKKKSK